MTSVLDWRDEPLGPDDLTIATNHGTVAEPASWMALVRDELAQPDGFVTVNSGPPHLYAQAANLGGTLVLEYRDGAPDQHFQARGVTVEQVAAALSQWFDGGREFIADQEWTRIDL